MIVIHCYIYLPGINIQKEPVKEFNAVYTKYIQPVIITIICTYELLNKELNTTNEYIYICQAKKDTQLT